MGIQPNEIEEVANHQYIVENFTHIENFPLHKLAKILADGHVVANMVGNMEFGPRALGNRSFLADPRKMDIVANINDAVKNRDFWMPFTPSMLDCSAKKYLVNPKELSAPYMTMAFETTEIAQTDIPAALHPVDKTARPQIVSSETNKLYYDLLKEFEKLTGVGALLNTSLNIHGKPIVYKPLNIVEEILMNELVKLHFIKIEHDIFISNSAIESGMLK